MVVWARIRYWRADPVLALRRVGPELRRVPEGPAAAGVPEGSVAGVPEGSVGIRQAVSGAAENFGISGNV